MKRGPNKKGHFGEFGGRYVPDTLLAALDDVTSAFESAKKDPEFKQQLSSYLKNYVGRPTPLFHATRLSDLTGHRVYLKREDLNHTGAHKINNSIAQALLAQRMGKDRIIAETGAGQHGVATATACALLGLNCVVYMGAADIERQALNVYRMKLLGAEVKSVETGSRTLKDATSEAIRDWLANVDDTFYIIGSVVGPHPYPLMVRYFQSVIGSEARRQIRAVESVSPDVVIACVGGGSNAMGIFDAFVSDSSVELVAVEAGGTGLESGEHSASLTYGRPGVLHGSKSQLLQTATGQIDDVHSISAGLDYPGVGPELAYLAGEGRIRVANVSDAQALAGCEWLSQYEGIIPALESSHAVAYFQHHYRDYSPNSLVIINISGRGDKDMGTLMAHVA